MITIRNRPHFDANWTFVTGAVANDTPRGLFVRTFEYPAGYDGHSHQHRLAQIIYPVRGIVCVETDDSQITVSPYRAVCIPSWVQHRVSANGNVSMRSVFLDPETTEVAQTSPVVLAVSPLLHELIRQAGSNYGEIPEGTIADQILQLIGMLLFQSFAADGYIALPRITHHRLASAMGKIEDELPWLTTDGVAQRLALSPRQFRRLFKQHTGMTFNAWRALVRVKLAVQKIAAGQSITSVASELFFSSSSAFGETFKRHTGMTPSEFAVAQRRAK